LEVEFIQQGYDYPRDDSSPENDVMVIVVMGGTEYVDVLQLSIHALV